MTKLIAVTLAALALPVSAALAADHPDNPKSPAKACKTLRSANEGAFKMQYRNFGKCVSEHAKARTRTTEAIRAQENAAKTCKAAKKDDADAFTEEWGSGRNGFGKCVSATAKENRRSGGDDTATAHRHTHS